MSRINTAVIPHNHVNTSYRWILSFLFILASLVTPLNAQEIKSTVQVIPNPQLNLTNKQVLTTLQQSAQQFINTRKWTEETPSQTEKIEMSLFFEITAMENSDFAAKLQVQVIRPVYGSTYKTTILNFNDEDVSFAYREFESLDYQDNMNMNDFTTLLAFYVNIALGMDFDSYGLMSGNPYFGKAMNIVNMMATKSGWKQGDGKGNRNRFYLAENLNNPRFKDLRNLTYVYHRNGMDQFSDNPDQARKEITDALKKLSEQATLLQNSLLQKTFFVTKWPELVEIYKGATAPEKANIVKLLQTMDPPNSARYEKIKA